MSTGGDVRDPRDIVEALRELEPAWPRKLELEQP